MRSRSLLFPIALTVVVTLIAPVGTATAQDADGSQASVQLLNPSEYGTVVAASARDMDRHGYHLVATVDRIPADPHVLFEIESEESGRRRIGTASQEGSDTFGLHWLLPPEEELESGTYTLRVVLFSQGKQVAEDEVEISVQQSWPTVKLDNAVGPLGIYKPPGEDRPWNTILDYTYSSGSEHVAFFYSMTAPGSEPEWTGCGSVRVSSSLGEGAEEPGSGRFVCEFAGEDDATKVTAVAAIATDDPFPLPRMGNVLLFGDASGDAHRALPYRQGPAGLRLASNGPRSYKTGACTEQIVAFVTDQNGRPVAGVNVDVHAMGPDATDGRAGLRFDVSTGNDGTDENQSPDENHQDETEAWSCKPRQSVAGVEVSGPGPSGTQGNHRRPRGDDTRHVESTENGTDAGGRFRFRLYNDQAGSTQIAAWSDLDGDDAHCAREPMGQLSLGWDQFAPGIAPHPPERSSCRLPGDIEEVQEQSQTRHGRSVSIRLKSRRAKLLVEGRVRARDGFRSCQKKVPLNLQRRKKGKWETLRSPSTDRKGRYRALVPKRNGRYRVIAVSVYRGENFQHFCARAAKAKTFR